MKRAPATENELREGRAGPRAFGEYGPPRWRYLAGNGETQWAVGAVLANSAIANEFVRATVGPAGLSRTGFPSFYEMPRQGCALKYCGADGIDPYFWEAIAEDRGNTSLLQTEKDSAGLWPAPRHSAVTWAVADDNIHHVYILGGQTAAFNQASAPARGGAHYRPS